MLALLAAALLAQPPVAVVQTSNFGVPAKRAGELTRALGELMKKQGMQPIEVQGTCEDHACMLAKAGEVKAVAVISIAFAIVGKDTLLDLEALRTRDQASLAQATFKVPPNSSLRPGETAAFLEKIEMAVKPAVVAEPVKEPQTPPSKVEPPKSEPPLTAVPPEAVVEESESSRSLAPPIVLGVVGVAAGVASAVLLGFARHEHGVDLNTITDNGPITMTQAWADVAPANRLYTASLITAIAAAAFIGVALWLFLRD